MKRVKSPENDIKPNSGIQPSRWESGKCSIWMSWLRGVGWVLLQPTCIMFEPVLSAYSDFSIAITAVYWFVATRLKWYPSIFTTLSTCCREHLSLWPVSVVTNSISIAFRFPSLAARRAAPGFVGEAFSGEEFLLSSRKGERLSTIGTCEGFLGVSH